MRRTLITAALLALTLATGGCEFDLTEVQDQSATEAHLFLQLEVREHRGPLQVTAWFHPGTDDRGRTRAISDDSLRLNGLAVAPDEVTREGARFYRISGLDASAPPRRFRPPRVAAIGEAPPEVLVEPLRIQASDTLITARTGTLELRLAGMGDVQQASDGFWTFSVHPSVCDEGDLLSMRGTTAPPSVLRVPVDLFPGELKKGVIQYRGSAQHAFASIGGSYTVQVSRSFSACIPLMVSD